jgi:Zn-dependent protease with chaperone function
MLTKPLIFVLTFFLAIINLMVALVPLQLLLTPFTYLFPAMMEKIGMDIMLLILLFITSYMIAYLLLDWLFAFTVRAYTRNTLPLHKATSIYGHQDIADSFAWLLKRFQLRNVELRINGDVNTINAYAIGSMRRKVVVLTMGLVNHIHNESHNHDQYVDAIRGILGHELSHLANKDYLPALLTIANETAIHIIDKIIFYIFKIISKIIWIIPFIGTPLSHLIMLIYKTIDSVLMGIYKLIFMPIYRFLQKTLNRSVEFRCDRDAAFAFGGSRIATGLAMLGPGSYFSIFSTHPRTKTRIRKVEKITSKPGYIRPSIITWLLNLASLLFIVYVWYMLTLVAPIDDILEELRSLTS